MLTKEQTDLQALIQSSITTSEFSLESVQDALKTIRNIPIEEKLNYSEYFYNNRIDDVKTKIFGKYLAAEISKEFKLLSPELFELKRVLKVQFVEDEVIIQDDFIKIPDPAPNVEKKIQTRWLAINLLTTCSIGEERSYLGKLKIPGRKNHYVQFYCNLPVKMPPSARKAGFKAKELAYQAIAKLYQNDLIAKELDYQIENNSRLLQFRSRIYWIPELKHIYNEKIVIPPAADPALIMAIAGQRFLIETWDEEENSVLDSLLKEFS